VGRTRDLVDRLRTLPGVTHAAAADLMPLRDAGVRGVVVADRARGQRDQAQAAAIGGVTSDFFDVLNVAIAKGRMFTDAEERARSEVAVVNRTLAERLWPGEDTRGVPVRRASTEARTTWSARREYRRALAAAVPAAARPHRSVTRCASSA
jgi:MacB-like periplasmic core domain